MATATLDISNESRLACQHTKTKPLDISSTNLQVDSTWEVLVPGHPFHLKSKS